MNAIWLRWHISGCSVCINLKKRRNRLNLQYKTSWQQRKRQLHIHHNIKLWTCDEWLVANLVRALFKLPSACPAEPAGGSWAAVNACCLPRSSLAGSCPAPVSAAPLRSGRHPADSAASHSPPLRLPIVKHLQVYTQVMIIITCNCTEWCHAIQMLPLCIFLFNKVEVKAGHLHQSHHAQVSSGKC